MAKRFVVQGIGPVQHVAFRIQLINKGFTYNNLMVLPKNIVGKNAVEVIVDGNEEDLTEFYKFVQKEDIRIYKKDQMYTLDPLEDYNGPPIDWILERDKIIMEQLITGAIEIFRMKDNIKNLISIVRSLQKNVTASKKKKTTKNKKSR